MVGKTVNVGLFGIGLDTYWAQFEGLEEKLLGYLEQIARKMDSPKIRVINAGMVDNSQKAREAGELLKRENVEIVFLYISTYALSSTVLPVAQIAKAPFVMLNLQPTAAVDYAAFNTLGDRGKMTGEWLSYCQACSVPEIASVFNQTGIHYDIVTGHLEDREAWDEIDAWLDAAYVSRVVKTTRFGILGHYYCGMLDVYTDVTKQAAVFGSHYELLEMCELKQLRDSVTEERIREKLSDFRVSFDVSPECSETELRRTALTSCALDALVRRHDLGAMAYYYEGAPGNDYEDIATSVIAGNSLLTARNIPVAGECEVKNAMAMKIMDTFDCGGSFSEYYAMDFNEDVVLLGHDGPAHFAIAEGRVGLVPLPVYHGKPGCGLSIQMTVKHGPVTLLSVVEGKEGVFLLYAEGESAPGPVFEIGNTNSRYKFPLSAKEFVNRWSKMGPAHHCAIGVGHIGEKLEKLAKIIGIEAVKIC